MKGNAIESDLCVMLATLLYSKQRIAVTGLDYFVHSIWWSLIQNCLIEINYLGPLQIIKRCGQIHCLNFSATSQWFIYYICVCCFSLLFITSLIIVFVACKMHANICASSLYKDSMLFKIVSQYIFVEFVLLRPMGMIFSLPCFLITLINQCGHTCSNWLCMKMSSLSPVAHTFPA